MSYIHIPVIFFSIEDNGYHLMISSKINTKKALMLVDTGASKTVIDKNRIHRFVKHNDFKKNDKPSVGLGTNSMESEITNIEKIQMGKLCIFNYTVVLLDLSHVNAAYRKLKCSPIDGIIGSDILQAYKGIIDYGKKLLKMKNSKHIPTLL